MYTVFEGYHVTMCVSLLSGMLAADRNVEVTLATDDMLGSGGMPSELIIHYELAWFHLGVREEETLNFESSHTITQEIKSLVLFVSTLKKIYP